MNPSEVKMSYTFTGKFDDFTEGLWISFMSETGEQIVGMPASEFANLKERMSPEELRMKVNEKTHEQFTVILKPQIDTYQQSEESNKFRY